MGTERTIYGFRAKSIEGAEVSFDNYRSQVLLIVNVASRCGFTPQYSGLEMLYEKYRTRGFSILGFPCNQFGGQEPASESEIKGFCETSYGVAFPLFAKIDVNGPKAHPLYDFLKEERPGLFGTEAIKWNFTKFLVDRNGQPIKRFGPRDAPESLEADILKALDAPAATP